MTPRPREMVWHERQIYRRRSRRLEMPAEKSGQLVSGAWDVDGNSVVCESREGNRGARNCAVKATRVGRMERKDSQMEVERGREDEPLCAGITDHQSRH
jgi:hypothetical protein